MVEHGKKREKRKRFERFSLEEIRTNMLSQWKQTSDNSWEKEKAEGMVEDCAGTDLKFIF